MVRAIREVREELRRPATSSAGRDWATRTTPRFPSSSRWRNGRRGRCCSSSARRSIWLILGVSIGVLSAVKRRTAADRAAMGFVLIGISAPVFWLGLMALYIFWNKLHLTGGTGYVPITESPTGFFSHMILPWTVLALALRRHLRAYDAQHACSRRSGRTTSAPPGPRDCQSDGSSRTTRCGRAWPRS